jgi:hypothetical protein
MEANMTTEIRMTLNALDDIATEITKYCAFLEAANDELAGRLTELGASPENLADLQGDLRRKIIRMSDDITRLEMNSNAPCAADPEDDDSDRKQIAADGRVYDYLKRLLIITNDLDDQTRQHEDDELFNPTCANMDGIRSMISKLRVVLMQFAFEYRPALGGHFSNTSAPDRKEVISQHDDTIADKTAAR